MFRWGFFFLSGNSSNTSLNIIRNLKVKYFRYTQLKWKNCLLLRNYIFKFHLSTEQRTFNVQH